MKRIAACFLLWLIPGVIVNGQKEGSKPITNQTHPKGAKSPQSDRPQPTSLRLDAVQEQTSEGKQDGAKAQPQSYPSRLFSPENLPNIGLFVAGLLGIGIAIGTLSEMKTQRNIMQGQLAEMKAGGELTKASADAARDSVEIVISKERARLSVEPELLKLPNEKSDTAFFSVCYRIKHQGATDAKIIGGETFALLTDSEAAPSLDDAMSWGISAPQWFTKEDSAENHYQAVWKVGKIANVDMEDARDLRGGKQFIHFWGFIKYEDIFGRSRMCTFRWMWKRSEFQFGRSSAEDLGYWRKYGSDQDNNDQ